MRQVYLKSIQDSNEQKLYILRQEFVKDNSSNKLQLIRVVTLFDLLYNYHFLG